VAARFVLKQDAADHHTVERLQAPQAARRLSDRLRLAYGALGVGLTFQATDRLSGEGTSRPGLAHPLILRAA
jgi:hypothetical protein